MTVQDKANQFRGFKKFRPRNEDEKRADYGRELFKHAREQYPDAEQVSDGALFEFLAPLAGYASHGSLYAAVNGRPSGNGSGGTRASSKEALVKKVAGIDEKIAALNTQRTELQAKIETWDTDHAEDVKKQAEKKEKAQSSAVNFLSALSPEERAAFMESFNARMAG